jgi:broad specificity phosphatase PhoE
MQSSFNVNGFAVLGQLFMWFLSLFWRVILLWKNRNCVKIASSLPSEYNVTFYIVRHCEKVPCVNIDPPLTNNGHDSALEIGQGIARQMQKFGQASVTAILASPYRRTIETACGIRKSLLGNSIQIVSPIELEWVISEATLQTTTDELLDEKLASQVYSPHVDTNSNKSVFTQTQCQHVQKQLISKTLNVQQWQTKRLGMLRYTLVRWLQRWITRQPNPPSTIINNAVHPCSNMVFIIVTHGTVYTDLITSLLMPTQFPPWSNIKTEDDWVALKTFDKYDKSLYLMYSYIQNYFEPLLKSLWNDIRGVGIQDKILQGATTMLVGSSASAVAEYSILKLQPERTPTIPCQLLHWCIQNNQWPVD